MLGPAFTLALRDCTERMRLYVPSTAPVAHWIIRVWRYESGLNPTCPPNRYGYSGLWQAPARDGRPYYQGRTAAQQVRECTAFWVSQVEEQKISVFEDLGHFYCLNLAPARVRAKHVVYAGPGPWKDLPDGEALEELEEASRRWPNAYAPNSQMDVARKGWLSHADLERPLMAPLLGAAAMELEALRQVMGSLPGT